MIVGDGPERSSLERLVEQLELKDAIQFTGEFSREEALHCVNRATLVIVPSYFEPFGLVALEAMQMKRPVIASRIGGLQEVIVDGETGILVPSREPVAFYHAIDALISDPNKAVWMGLNGYKRALSQFSLERNVAGYEACYEKGFFNIAE
jgi:glycosyltransferase involved in cell wall biosynthesis